MLRWWCVVVVGLTAVLALGSMAIASGDENVEQLTLLAPATPEAGPNWQRAIEDGKFLPRFIENGLRYGGDRSRPLRDFIVYQDGGVTVTLGLGHDTLAITVER